MNGFFEALHHIHYLCRKVGIRHAPRVSVTFATVEDRERFKMEILRHLKTLDSPVGAFNGDISEGRFANVDFRIL